MNAAIRSDRGDAPASGEWPTEDQPSDSAQISTVLDPPEVASQIAGAQRRRRMGRALRWTLVVVNLVLGVAGLVLPGLMGVLHLMIAVALLAPDVPAARRFTLGVFRKWPRVRRRVPRSIRDLTRREREPLSGDPPTCD